MFHKLFHPLIRCLCPLLRRFPLTVFRENPLPEKGPVIFVCNHSNMHDAPVALEIIRKQVFILAEEGPRGTPAGAAFSLNGVIWVNRTTPESGRDAVKDMEKLLEKGERLLIFPEGTWNVTEALPMISISWGAVRLARKARCPIVPITLEYPDFSTCRYSIGTPFLVEEAESDIEATIRLRDVMATMRWIDWEAQPAVPRSSITQHDYDAYSILRYKEYQPKEYLALYEREKQFIRYRYTRPEEVFLPIASIREKNITPQNVKMILAARELVQERTEKDYTENP